jgi:hypothetical protein
VAGGEEGADSWFGVEFGIGRPVTEVQLYFLDDVTVVGREAIGEVETSGFPVQAAEMGPPVAPPQGYHLEYRMAGSWESIPGQERWPLEPEGRRANTVTFPEILAEGVRVVMTPRSGATVGLTEMETWGAGALPPPLPPGPGSNLALNRTRTGSPSVAASFTYQGDSPWEAVDGRLALTRYSRNRWTAFGTPDPEDWLEVDFGREEEIGRVDLYLYGDGRGVAAPEDFGIRAWVGSGWVPVTVRSRIPAEPLAWGLNVVELDPVRTPRLRVWMRHAAPGASGISEVQAFR